LLELFFQSLIRMRLKDSKIKIIGRHLEGAKSLVIFGIQ